MKNIIKEHIEFYRQIFVLARVDLIRTYRGAALGWIWALVQPLTLLVVYWFVLRVGLRAGSPPGESDFFAWLMMGILPWFYLQDMLNKGTGAIRSYKHLVTKMKFPVSIIPTFIAISKSIIHLLLVTLGIAYLITSSGGEQVSIHWIQLPIIFVAMLLFFITWSLFAAPLASISKDFHNLVKSIGRVLFWLSGILWSVRQLEIDWIKNILLFNPITFFVEAYRKALLYGEWITEDPTSLVCFLLVWLALTILAIITYNRSRKDIVDVL